jgi:23S rRNA (uridine2552-2'-O)-methyltransferase
MRSKSSERWLKEHFSDPYVKRARQAGFRSRAAYKLIEIDDRHHLLQAGMLVVDLGAAPGGWSQVAMNRVGQAGTVIALDLLPIEPIPHVSIMTGDFSEDASIATLLAELRAPIDLLLSDMAPNISGHTSVDVPKALMLAESVFDFAKQHLRLGGTMLVKVFQGEGFDLFYATVKRSFKKTTLCKPDASRGRSREMYILARELIG